MPASASRYDGLRATAKRLIDKNGRAVSIERDLGEVPVDAAKPWLGVVPSISTTPTVAVFDQIQFLEQLVRLAGGRETPVRVPLESEQEVAYVPAVDLPFEPLPKHRLVEGSSKREILRVRKVAPGPVAILYILELAR